MYNYDSLGQLIEDWDFATQSVIRYTYDAGGNILKKETYANWNLNSTPTTVNYTYGNNTWKDLLTNFNGTSIAYDAVGNPINWRENIIFSWSNGRELSGVYLNGAMHSYTYDSDGTRIRKTTGGVTTTYYVEGGVCYGETRSDGVSLQYLRDETGKVIGLRYQNAGIDGYYYFVFNLQGDVVQIVDSTGKVIVNYTYDTWGRLLSATNASGGALSTGSVGRFNPFLYRGYYYDYETGFYYLQSRYYDPVVGRFLNADVYVTTGQGLNSFNTFAYCLNNPVNFVDRSGKSAESDALQAWSGSMWWLCGADSFFPFGDIAYVAGIVVLGIFAIAVSEDSTSSTPSNPADEIYGPPAPNNNSDDDDDYDDDYYDDDSNFTGREKMGHSKGNTPGNNQAQNKQFNDATRGLSPKERRIVHDKISGKGLGFHEIIDEFLK